MGVFRSRLERKLVRWGQTFTIGGKSIRAIPQELLSGMTGTYFDSFEGSEIIRPALQLLMSAGSTAAPGDQMILEGRTYTVKKVVSHRLGQEVVAKVAILW